MMNESELLGLLQSSYWWIRKAAAEHPNATEQVLLEAVKNE
jgi:hypothetical protein